MGRKHSATLNERRRVLLKKEKEAFVDRRFSLLTVGSRLLTND